MDLLSYLRILRRRWTLILAVALVGGAVGTGTALASSSDDDEYYKASHILFLDSDTSSGNQQAFVNLDQDALLVTSGDVPDRVGKKLGKDGRQLTEQVLITTNSATSTLEIAAAARDAAESEQIANAFAKELMASITEKTEQRFTAQRDRVIKRMDDLQAQIAQLDGQLAASPGSPIISAQRNGLVDQYRLTFEQFQQLASNGDPTSALSTLESAEAVPIGAPEYDERIRRGQLGENVVSINASDTETSDVTTGTGTTFQGPVSRGVLGGFLGLLAGIGLAVVAERLDRRLRTRAEIEEVFRLPVLAEVPVLTRPQQSDAEVLSFTSPLSRTAEAHRAIRSALIFQHVAGRSGTGANGARRANGETESDAPAVRWPERSNGDDCLVVLVTSASANEGKTTTAANLAAVFAESGASVLAVNCDFRRPTLHRYLGTEDEPRKVLETKIPGVKLVSGVISDPTANPAQIVAAQRQVVETATERFDIVLLDTAPLLSTNDAVELMPAVDAVVLVARPDVTTSDSALRVCELLDRVHAPAVGVVLVADDSTPADSYYYYSARRVSDDATSKPKQKAEPGATEPESGDLFPDEPTDPYGVASQAKRST